MLCEEWFLNYHISSNEDNAAKLSENYHDWHSLQFLRVHYEDYKTCDSPFVVRRIQSVEPLSDQLLTRPEEPEEEEEVVEHKATFLNALEATTKYMSFSY
jgi:hypothetical protein